MAPKKTKRKPARQSTLKLDAAPPAKKQRTVKPLTGPPVFDFGFGSQESERAPSPSQPSLSQKGLGLKLTAASLGPRKAAQSEKVQVKDVKGKGKATEKSESLATDDRMWVDVFEPRTEEELAVHKRKVADVRGWLREALDGSRLAKYRRLLVLTGPAGSGKTATIRVLARELGADIIEWRNASSSGAQGAFASGSNDDDWDSYESAMDKFESFIARAGSYRTIFTPSTAPSAPSSSASTQKPAPPPQPKRLILLEDLPNILHAPTRARFHSALRAHTMSPRVGVPPVVIVVSEAGLRGEGGDDADGAGADGWGRAGRREEVIDARTVVPEGVGTAWVTQIAFNPIAPTLLTPALKTLLARVGPSASVPAHVLQTIVDGANGDIRSAVMGLEFACARLGRRKRRDKDKGGEAMEAATRKEGALALFHLLGKVLYNKRKGDPPAPSATKKDIERDRALDATLRDEPRVPPWAADEARRASRVDVDALYAATPVDASLFGLYVHQNYTQFCDEVEQCAGVADALSWCDANGGDAWYQTNPHTFHLTALATLHALPSPVPRRAQKTYKPAFFDALGAARAADAALSDTLAWLARGRTTWSRADAACELGALLGAGLGAGTAHRAWSAMAWRGAAEGEGAVAEEGEAGALAQAIADMDERGVAGGAVEDVGGGWLEGDDIEEW